MEQHLSKTQSSDKRLREITPASHMAGLLLELNLKNYPWLHKKSPSVPDVTEIEKLNRLDGWTWEQIEAVIRWSAQDDFWARNILSGAKLRKQFDRLLIEINSKQSRKKNYNADLG